MKTHFLKSWTEHFDAVWYGLKKFEVRVNDRNYAVGDTLILRDFNPFGDGSFSGRLIACSVDHMIRGSQFGIAEGTVVMSITVKERAV